jgi:hypothetical protein
VLSKTMTDYEKVGSLVSVSVSRSISTDQRHERSGSFFPRLMRPVRSTRSTVSHRRSSLLPIDDKQSCMVSSARVFCGCM